MNYIPYEKIKWSDEMNGKWFFVKLTDKMGGHIFPCRLRRNFNKWQFLSLNADGSISSIMPPRYFLAGIYPMDMPNNSNVVANDNTEEINQKMPEQSNDNFNEIIDYIDNPEIFFNLRDNINKSFDDAVSRYIESNKKFNIGDKVIMKEPDDKGKRKMGVIFDIIYTLDGIKYVCNLIRKDGGNSTNLMTTKNGNLAEEIELLD